LDVEKWAVGLQKDTFQVNNSYSSIQSTGNACTLYLNVLFLRWVWVNF